MKIHSIHAGHFSCDGGALFGVIPKKLWQKAYPANEENIVQLTLRCLLIETGGRKILIETGAGDHYNEKFIQNNGLTDIGILERSLAEKGFTPEDITDVFFTHLHWDHCNGAVKNVNGSLQLVFPDATHWCSKRQWEQSQSSNVRERAAFSSEIIRHIAEHGNLHLAEKEGELIPGISVRFFDGHTPGMMIPFIGYEGKTIVYTSDLIPTIANIPLLWIAAYDLFPVTVMEEKEKFLKVAADKSYILFFEHDFYNQAATVIRTDRGFGTGMPINDFLSF